MADTIRGRYRAHVRDEVKEVALRQLAEGGPQALSVNAIAKELGVSGPALYRYFAGRDDLLTELILDAYHDFGAALRDRTDVRSLVAAYRAWALAQPHRYRLLFSAPLPGYDAHAEPLVAAAQEAMDVVLAVLGKGGAGSAPPPEVPARLRRQLAAWAKARVRDDVDPAVAAHAVVLWARVHGMVSLEIEDNFASMGLDPDPLYEML
jgi:AcrR family transcriptional regulator